MIDPLEAAIQFLLGRSELVDLESRIASKHKYGEEWLTNQTALVVILDDSNPNWYVQMHDVRLEVWCMAADDDAAMDLWQILVGLSRTKERIPVVTSKGNALVYSFVPESGPSYLPDEELNMVKRILSFWKIQVSEVAVA
jgi:hypothetical protein